MLHKHKHTPDLLYRPNNNQYDLEDIFIWPDSTWCYRYEQGEMRHMSDDYEILQFDSPEYNMLLEKFNG